MKRRATQLLFAVGLLLTLASVGMFVRAFWAMDQFSVTRFFGEVEGDALVEQQLALTTDGASFALQWHRYAFDLGGPLADFHVVPVGTRADHSAHPPRPFRLLAPDAGSFPARLGFRATWGEASDESGWALQAPPWAVILACAALTAGPFLSLRRHARSRRRAASGQCVPCGYDLRGTAHERCPECGARPGLVAV